MKRFSVLGFMLLLPFLAINTAKAEEEIDCRVALVDCEKHPESKCCANNDDEEIDCRKALVDCEKFPNSKCCGGEKAGNPNCVKSDGSFAKVGESFKVDCNTCECTRKGPGKCTKMACPRRDDDGEDAIDCRVVRVDCRGYPNHKCCSASKAGNPKCQKNDGSFAKIGEFYKVDCNTCECTKKGPGKCTKEECMPGNEG